MNKIMLAMCTLVLGFVFGGMTVFHLDREVAKLPIAVSAEAIPTPTPSMLELINDARNMHNVASVSANIQLQRSATAKACDMERRGYFDHADPAGVFGWHFFKEAGYIYNHAGENLVENSQDPTSDMFYLMVSDTHREVILDPDYTEVGIGRCGIYTVQHFGSKL